MIELSVNAILILDPEGRSVPFDVERLRLRIVDCFNRAGTPDEELAADIALSVEYALRAGKQKNPDAPLVLSTDVDLMASKILDDIGYGQAAELFRNTASAPAAAFLVEMNRIRSFLEREFPENGANMDWIVRKVHHTLTSIGADSAAPGLIVELAKHFLLTADRGGNPPEIQIRFSPRKLTLTQPLIASELKEEYALELLHKRVITIQDIDLRLFPVLRFHVRLSGLTEGLTPPITELSLSPALFRIADAMDSIALAADAAWKKLSPTAETPLKTAVYLADSSVFVHDWMGCINGEQGKRCATSLAQILASMMARRPFRFYCR